MTKFAENTTVPVEKSRAEIEQLIIRYGATHTAFMSAPGRAIICFEAKERRIMFELPLPNRDDNEFAYRKFYNGKKRNTPEQVSDAWEQACRQKWRALALVIKAKLEAVASGITTFEDEFMAHIVMPDGQTVSTHIKPRIKAAYESNTMQPLLPAPSRAP